MRNRRAVSVLVLVFLLAAAAPLQAFISHECVECGGIDGRHNRGCSALGSSPAPSTRSDQPQGDLFDAPIFAAPMGLVGGIFMGGGWYFGEMAGKYPKVGFLKSYSDFLSFKDDGTNTTSALNFGAHIGALPWLALYIPTYPIRAGIVALAEVASRPSPPKPPKPQDPAIVIHETIAKNYEMRRREAEGERKKAEGDIRAAERNRDRHLDAFIADNDELRKLKESKGIDAAREAAAKKLDAWSRSRREKRKIATGLMLDIHGKDAFCRKTIENVGYRSLFADETLGGLDERLGTLTEDKTLPAGVADSLEREKARTWILRKSKTAFEIVSNAKELRESFVKARDEGRDITGWVSTPETRESILQLNLKLLTAPDWKRMKLASAAGGIAGVAETALDAGYAVVANTYFAAHVEEERELLQKLATARVFEDAAADEWDRVNMPLEAAQVREKTIRELHDRYAKMTKESENHANRLRRN